MGTEEGGQKPGNLIKAIIASDVAALLNFDLYDSIGSLLKAAANALQSEEASILIRKDEAGGLVFLKAIGKVGDQLSGVEVPPGKGIAGFVAVSGQPVAISDVGREDSFYSEIDRKTGFSTEILLATPLFFDGEILGVLEFINRIGAPPYEPFNPEEMDRAAVYADALAALVNAYLATSLSDELVKHIGSDIENTTLQQQREFIDNQRGKTKHKELLELAVLLREISDRGDGHRKLCREILESIVKFAGEAEDLDYSDV